MLFYFYFTFYVQLVIGIYLGTVRAITIVYFIRRPGYQYYYYVKCTHYKITGIDIDRYNILYYCRVLGYNIIYHYRVCIITDRYIIYIYRYKCIMCV